jgi:hypothetical protein
MMLLDRKKRLEKILKKPRWWLKIQTVAGSLRRRLAMGENIVTPTALAFSLLLLLAAYSALSGGKFGGIGGDPAISGAVGGNSNVWPVKRASDCNPMARAGTSGSCLF